MDNELSGMIAEAAEPLPEIDDHAFAEAFDRYGDARVVLLGEASHGTSEFYRARAAITRRLIERHGFNIVAVEADWPDAAALNRRVRSLPEREEDAHVFERFPHWMWRNREAVSALRGPAVAPGSHRTKCTRSVSEGCVRGNGPRPWALMHVKEIDHG